MGHNAEQSKKYISPWDREDVSAHQTDLTVPPHETFNQRWWRQELIHESEDVGPGLTEMLNES